MHNQRELRLKHLLQGHLDRLGGSLSALERAINEAARRPHAIDRRKLKSLLAGKNVTLRISELEALDDFLNNYHQGLAFVPLFERPALLETLVAMKQVHFLVGARSIKKNLSVSHFDTEAYGHIARFLTSPRLEVVLMHTQRRRGVRNIQIESWEWALQSEKAVVAIASPLSNRGTNRMLELMFGLPSYVSPSPFEGRRRPELAFVMPEPHLSRAASSFVESPAHMPGKRAHEIHDRCWALRVGEELFVSQEEQGDQRWSTTYGVIVAQRRASGQIWVVVAGLHGAGTHAAACALPAAEISLASGRQGADGPVHVRVVEAHVTTTRSHGTIIGRVEDQQILTKFNRAFDPRAPGSDSLKKQAS
jgi:hypothetical protein